MNIPKLKSLSHSGARREEQACFIWITLTGWVAHNKNKTITYGQLAELLGYSPQAGRTLSEALGTVSLYCLYNNLPPLSCIVVSKNTNTPGWEGMIPSDSSLEEEQNRVWNTSWNLYRTPSISTFRRTREQLDFDDYI
ncbi:hypothetical protein AAFF89_003953 [Providencia stuartii]|uniref:hypothetical protein n=1 Tax=Proteus penneri TaxID=102862 RepID=UPI00288C1C34|nr:hypothetical protein [Proteus penneri]